MVYYLDGTGDLFGADSGGGAFDIDYFGAAEGDWTGEYFWGWGDVVLSDKKRGREVAFLFYYWLVNFICTSFNGWVNFLTNEGF